MRCLEILNIFCGYELWYFYLSVLSFLTEHSLNIFKLKNLLIFEYHLNLNSECNFDSYFHFANLFCGSLLFLALLDAVLKFCILLSVNRFQALIFIVLHPNQLSWDQYCRRYNFRLNSQWQLGKR